MREILSAGAAIEVTAYLGCDHDLISARFQGFAEKLLAMSEAINIGCVEKVAPELERASDRFLGDLVFSRTVAIAMLAAADCPRAKTYFRDLYAAVAKLSVFHECRSMPDLEVKRM